MEIKFNDVNYKTKLTDINITLNNSKINGVYNYNSFLKVLLNPKLIEKGNITIDGKVYNKYDPKVIAVIDKDMPFYTSKVIDEILFYSKIRGYKNNNIKEDINNLLEKFNLDSNILKRIGHSLSETEKYYIKLIANLIYKPKIIIFKDIMSGMDYKNKKIIKKLMEELKEQGVLIILTSSNSNILYELTDEVVIFNKGKVLINGSTNDIYSNIEILLNNNIDVPYFSLLTYKANNEKGAHLFYRKDVRDVIKDVYKSVS